MKPILDEISKQWDGTMIPFPEAKGMEKNIHIFMVKGRTRAFIADYKVNEDWGQNTDVIIPVQDFRKINFLETFFHAPFIVAVEFNDRHTFIKAAHLNDGQTDMIHPDGAFLPKERFQLLRKKEQAA